MKIDFALQISGSINVRLRPPKPGALTYRVTGELDMSTMIFEVTLPPTSAPDVVSRELTLTVDGIGEPVPVAEGQLVIPNLRALQGSTVLLTLTDIDDAGNRSEPSTLQFVAADTIAPAKPGEMAVRITGEEA